MNDFKPITIVLKRVSAEPTVCALCGDLVDVGPLGLCAEDGPQRFCEGCGDSFAPEAAAALRGAVERAMGG